jgi:hypothetical protein
MSGAPVPQPISRAETVPTEIAAETRSKVFMRAPIRPKPQCLSVAIGLRL